MSRSHFLRVKSLFRQVLDVDPELRDAFVREHCDDEQTRRDLCALLDAHETAAQFLETPLQSPSPETEPVSTDADRLAGSVIGDFQLVNVVGAGGHATVYRAIQQQPRRDVALKLMHRRLADAAWVQRFRDESDILARLDHPGIAKVYASGQFDDFGERRNWIAMEWIDGSPLDRFVEQVNFNVRQKLILIRQICLAAAHAHAKGIVHRDLKPSNILVTGSDAHARPVIVDFGIARVMDRSESDRSLTADGTVLGTLTHMSPEQLVGEIDRVSAASDVYALGVIGYELLAGRPPLEMKRGSLRDVIERGVNEDPMLLGRIDRQFRGDVEAIFATALQKDPDFRYVSAAAMAQDLDDYLNSKSISVRRPRATTRCVRFVKRNRGPVAAAGSILVVAIAGAAFYFIAARRANVEAAAARYEADKALAINNFITNDVMTNLMNGMSDADSSPRDRLDSILDQTSAKTHEMFGDRPVIEAAVRNELGTMRYNIGQFDDAAGEFQVAGTLWGNALGDRHSDTLKASNNLALCWMRLGEGDRAEPLLRDTLASRRATLGDDDEQTLATMNNLAELLSSSGRLDEAQHLLSEAYDRQLRATGFENKQALIFAANLGTLMIRRGHGDQALELHRRVFHGCQRELGESHVTTQTAGFRYAQTLYSLEQYDAALEILQPLHQMTEHSLTFQSLANARLLSRIYRNLGKQAEAKRVLEDALPPDQSQPVEFDAIIEKIKRDLSRL